MNRTSPLYEEDGHQPLPLPFFAALQMAQRFIFLCFSCSNKWPSSNLLFTLGTPRRPLRSITLTQQNVFHYFRNQAHVVHVQVQHATCHTGAIAAQDFVVLLRLHWFSKCLPRISPKKKWAAAKETVCPAFHPKEMGCCNRKCLLRISPRRNGLLQQKMPAPHFAQKKWAPGTENVCSAFHQRKWVLSPLSKSMGCCFAKPPGNATLTNGKFKKQCKGAGHEDLGPERSSSLSLVLNLLSSTRRHCLVAYWPACGCVCVFFFFRSSGFKWLQGRRKKPKEKHSHNTNTPPQEHCPTRPQTTSQHTQTTHCGVTATLACLNSFVSPLARVSFREAVAWHPSPARIYIA